jgi:hypothetical protein
MDFEIFTMVGFEPITFFYKVWGARVSSPPLRYVGFPERGAESKLRAACEASSLARTHTLSLSLSWRSSSSSSLSAPELQRSSRRSRKRSKKRIAKSGHNTPLFPAILKLFQLITCPMLNLFILNLFMCFCCYCF